MPRPPANNGENSALSRIENAFWVLLEQSDYKDITVKAISSYAKVNHNTFYYYFRSIDDLAKYCFKKLYKVGTMPDENLLFDNRIYKLGDGTDNPDAYDRWLKISLFTCKDSKYLLNIFEETLLDYWMNKIGVDYNDLTFDEKTKLSFISAGACEAVSISRKSNNPQVLLNIFTSDLGLSIVNIIKSISNNHKKKN